jgi:hypothetical protein
LAVTIVATVGGASANSFVLLSEAASYMEGRLNSDSWDDATTDEQNRALVEATREISSIVGWCGRRVDDTQALAWPRYMAPIPDSGSGWYFSETEIPQAVKDATMELAFQFLVAGTTDIASLDSTLNVRVKTVDVLTTEYFEPNQRITGLKRYPRVWRLIAPLIEYSGGQINVVRG